VILETRRRRLRIMALIAASGPQTVPEIAGRTDEKRSQVRADMRALDRAQFVVELMTELDGEGLWLLTALGEQARREFQSAESN
jgi:hypothetical protein